MKLKGTFPYFPFVTNYLEMEYYALKHLLKLGKKLHSGKRESYEHSFEVTSYIAHALWR